MEILEIKTKLQWPWHICRMAISTSTNMFIRKWNKKTGIPRKFQNYTLD